MKETLASMAARIGCSTTTISRVLSGQARRYRISDATVKIVMEEVQKSNYTPNLIAQKLRKTKTNTIGLLIPSVANPFFADLASVVISEANDRHFTTIVVDLMEDGSNPDEAKATLLSKHVDGLIVVPCSDNATMLEEVNAKIAPIVLIDRYYENSQLCYVTSNNYMGGRQATEFLISNGHKNIVCLQGMPESMPNRRRVSGYIDAMKEAGIESHAIVAGDEFSIQNGYLETKLILGSSLRPTAIFALSNTILLGAIKAIREARLTIPDDISIISFDNNKYLDYMVPPITRISQPVEDMARLASKILFSRIANPMEHTVTHLSLSPALIYGESVKANQ